MTEAQQKAAEADGVKRMMQGPFMFAAVSLRGARDMGPAMLLTVLGNILSALLDTWLLLKTKGLSYFGRVGFLVTLALTVGMIAHFPSWVWWNFSTSFTIVEFANLLIGWFLAGLVIGKVTSPPA